MTIDCNITDSRRSFEDVLYFVIYYVILPIYFIVGMTGNVMLLLAFRRQAKTDRAYAYQIFLTSSKTLEILCSSVFWWGYKWNAGIEKPGHAWYMNNYALMYFAAHIGCPLANGFIIASLLFSVAMTADRIFALAKPFVYKSINQRGHQAAAVVLCVLIGLGTSVFEVKRWRVSPGVNTTYIIEFDQEYLETELAMALGHLRTGVRLVCLIGLIVLNIVMAVIFRKRTQKVGRITAANDRKEMQRKAADKNLLVLTIYQSCLMAFAHIPHSIYFVGAFMSTVFDICYGPVVAPFADGCICVADAADLFVIIGINKKMRRTVQKVLPCIKDPPPGTTHAGGVTVSNVVNSRATTNMYGNEK